MKLNKIIRLVTVVLAVLGFCMLFGNQVILTITNEQLSISEQYTYTFAEVFFEGNSSNTIKPNITGFFAYVIILIVGILMALPIFIKKMDKRISMIITVSSLVLLLVSVVLLFVIPASFESGYVDALSSITKTNFKLSTTPIIAIIVTFLMMATSGTVLYLENFKK
ncbi:MAG: hypothetical protein ACI31G_04410 [Bacilli bacterium]